MQSEWPYETLLLYPGEEVIKRPFSPDLRHRIIAALDAGQPTAVVAERFSVSPRTVRRYHQRWRVQGTLDPTPHPGRHCRIRGADEAVLREQVLAAPDATLRAHRLQLHAHTGVWVSESTLCRALQRLQLTVKKTPDCQRATGSLAGRHGRCRCRPAGLYP